MKLLGQECYNLVQPLGLIHNPPCNQIKLGIGLCGQPQFSPGNVGLPLGWEKLTQMSNLLFKRITIIPRDRQIYCQTFKWTYITLQI